RIRHNGYMKAMAYRNHIHQASHRGTAALFQEGNTPFTDRSHRGGTRYCESRQRPVPSPPRRTSSMTSPPLDTICVIGLGYIGLPTAAVLAQAGKTVVGVDVKQSSVDAV